MQQRAARRAAHFSFKRAKKPFLGGQQHGSGSQQTGAGSQQTGSGSQQTGAGSQQGSGAGSQHGAGAGSQQVGSGSQQTGSGSQQTGSGAQQGSGSQQAGSGQHLFFFKQPNKPASADEVAVASTATTASKLNARTKFANFIISSRRNRRSKRLPDSGMESPNTLQDG
ncbi:MAG: hypothetical protein AAGF31_05805 [Planctomycetota bacterium]